ncbi:hypothetical protein [Fusobacterium varium]|uniref:hypothetical protein n=1 Tax=Fusobacterium varium TaxID=856 RepID=UPI001F3A1E2C|nr:hypothetical protein [Fusobacterium varium]MCF2673697.1 hypothetical protein [Fusobacterium varium]
MGRGNWRASLEKDIWIESNIEEHKKMNYFKIKSYINIVNRIDKILEEINEIKKLCEKNSINLVVVFLPLQKNTYLANNLKYLKEVKSKLSLITDYWDFVELNEYTENEYYWYENSHYRPMVEM